MASESIATEIRLDRMFNNVAHGFSISVPVDWDEASQEYVQQLNAHAATAAPNWPSPLIHYAYGRTNESNEAFPASIWVRVRELGHRPNPSEIEKDMLVDEGLLSTPTAGSKVEVHRKSFAYVPEADGFFTSATMQVPNGPAVGMHIASIMTERSVIRVICRSSLKDFYELEQVFAAVTSSVQVDENLKYRGGPPREALSEYWLIAAFALAFFWYVRKGRRKISTVP